MSNKRTRMEFDHRKDLQRNGFEVGKRDVIAFNGGTESETVAHYLTKALAAYHLKSQGYRVDSEVPHPRGRVDLLAYGTEDLPFVVEIETGMDEDVIADKLDRYVKSNDSIRECFVIDPAQLPIETQPAMEWIRGEL